MSFLKHFFVFHRDLGKHEEDSSLDDRAQSLLYFFPNSLPLTEKVSLMELIFAFLDISSLFPSSLKDPVHSITLGDCVYGLLEVEPHIYFCMGVDTPQPSSNNEVLPPQGSGGFTSWIFGSSSQASPSLPALIPMATKESLRFVLHQTYQHLFFLSGPLLTNPALSSPEFSAFVYKLIPILLNEINFDNLHCTPLRCLAGELNTGIEHLPLDRFTFFTVQSFLRVVSSNWNGMDDNDDDIPARVLLFNNQLVWNSLGPSYVISPVFAFCLKFFRINKLHQLDDGFLPLGRFTFSGEKQEGSKVFAPEVFFPNHNPTQRRRRLFALKLKRTLLLVFLPIPKTDGPLQDDEEAIMVQLQKFKSKSFGELDKINALLDEFTKRSQALEHSSQNSSAFVYANSLNLVTKTSPRFQQWTKSQILSESSFALSAMRAFQLSHQDATKATRLRIVVYGDWCVTRYKSGSRYLWTFSAASPKENAGQLLPGLQVDLDKLLANKFSNVLMT